MKDFEKRYVTSDNMFRVSIIREEYPENPRDSTDEPVYFEDYNREYSVMDRTERQNKYNNMAERVYYLFSEYADANKVVDLLIENGKHLTDGKKVCNNALEYNRTTKEWDVLEYTKFYSEKEYSWKVANSFDCKKTELSEYIYEIAESLTESSLEYICGLDFMPNIKIATYKFGYYGGLHVWEGVDFSGDGLVWVDKKEFLKYTGMNEDQWKAEKVSENWLVQEVSAWADNEVFGFVIEKRVDYDITKKCTSEEKETETYSETEWEETDSCWGFYGELDERQTEWILGEAGYKMAELKEVNE